MTGKEFIEESAAYLDGLHLQGASPNTIRGYVQAHKVFAQYLKKSSEEEKKITTATMVSFRDYLFEDGKKSSNTVSHYLTVLKAFFEDMKTVEKLAGNPVQKSIFPKMKKTTRDDLTRDEIRAVLSKAPEGMHQKNEARNRAIVVLLIQCGMRNSELRALSLSDLDFQGQTIRIRHGKGDKERLVPFPCMAREAVRQYLESGCRPCGLSNADLLFGSCADSDGKIREKEPDASRWHEISSGNLLAMVSSYVEKITGHSGIGVHDLRHAAASLWDDMGVPMRAIQGALGHASITTTEKIYISVLRKNKAAEEVNQAFTMEESIAV